MRVRTCAICRSRLSGPASRSRPRACTSSSSSSSGRSRPRTHSCRRAGPKGEGRLAPRCPLPRSPRPHRRPLSGAAAKPFAVRASAASLLLCSSTPTRSCPPTALLVSKLPLGWHSLLVRPFLLNCDGDVATRAATSKAKKKAPCVRKPYEHRPPAGAREHRTAAAAAEYPHRVFLGGWSQRKSLYSSA